MATLLAGTDRNVQLIVAERLGSIFRKRSTPCCETSGGRRGWLNDLCGRRWKGARPHSRRAPARGVFGGLFLNLSEGFREALTQPFRILIRIDTDALIAGSDFETKAIERFDSDPRLGSLGSFRVGYTGIGIRSARWVKQRVLIYFADQAWRKPRAATVIARILLRARK